MTAVTSAPPCASTESPKAVSAVRYMGNVSSRWGNLNVDLLGQEDRDKRVNPWHIHPLTGLKRVVWKDEFNYNPGLNCTDEFINFSLAACAVAVIVLQDQQ